MRMPKYILLFSIGLAIGLLAVTLWVFQAPARVSAQPAEVSSVLKPLGRRLSATPVNGDVTSSETWTLAGSPYILQKDINVIPGVTLTVEPGVEVLAAGRYGLQIQGHLEAQGTALQPITFTHETESDTWRGLGFNGGTGVLHHVAVRYGGRRNNATLEYGNITVSGFGSVHIESSRVMSAASPDPVAGIHVADGYVTMSDTYIVGNGTLDEDDYGLYVETAASVITVTDSVFERNLGYAVYMWTEQLDGAFSNNVFINNQVDRVQLEPGVAPPQATLWVIQGAEGYELEQGELLVPTGVTLTVQPGVAMMADSGVESGLRVQGHLQSSGTAAMLITFTTSASGGWAGIFFDGGTGVLDYTTVAYAGNPNAYPGDENGKGVISNIAAVNVLTGEVRIANSQVLSGADGGTTVLGYGIFVSDSHVLISNTLFAGNCMPTPTDKDYALYVGGDLSVITVENNIFHDNYGHAAWLKMKYINDVVNNVFTGLEANNRRIRVAGGNSAYATTLSAQYGLHSYVYEDDLVIRSGDTLIVEPGIAVMAGTGNELNVLGHLHAVGTLTSPITFTSEPDSAKQQWDGLVFEGGTGMLDYVTVQRTGGRLRSFGFASSIYAVGVQSGVVQVAHSYIANNGRDSAPGLDYALYVTNSHVIVSDTVFLNNGTSSGDYTLQALGTESAVTITDNVFEDNYGYAGYVAPWLLRGLYNNVFSGTMGIPRVQVPAGTVLGAGLMAYQQGLESYELAGDVAVAVSATLTVEPGVVVMGKVAGTNDAYEIQVLGHLQALGTTAQPITFTSVVNNGPGQWAGLVFDGGTGDLRYTTVRYAGYVNNLGQRSNITVKDVLDGRVQLSQVQILDSGDESATADYALYVENSYVVLDESRIQGNGQATGVADSALYVAGASTAVTLTGTAIRDNNAEGITVMDGYVNLLCSEVATNVLNGVNMSGGNVKAVGTGLFNNTLVDFNYTAGQVDARYNWWGQPGGPSVGQTQGLSPADYTPYLTEYRCVADLCVSKQALDAPVLAGTPLTYAITVTNSGPAPATSVVISDILPAATRYITGFGGVCEATDQGAMCALPNLLPVSATTTFTLVVVPDVDGLITNVVSVRAYQSDHVPGSEVATATTTISPATDLVVMIQDFSAPVRASYPFSYTVVVHNPGPSLAQNVVLTHSVLPTVTFMSATPGGGGACVGRVCSWVELARQRSVTATVWVRPELDGDIVNTARVMPLDTPELRKQDNVTTAMITVEPVVALALDMNITPDPLQAGQGVTYTLTLTNSGPSTAWGLVITDVLPQAMMFVTGALSMPGRVVNAADNVTFTLDSLPRDVPVTLTLLLDVAPWARGTLTNVARAQAQEFEANGLDNVVSVPASVVAWADVQLSQTDAPAMPVAGDYVTYTFVLTNAGPADASDVALTSTLPPDLMGVVAQSSGVCTVQHAELACTFASLPVTAPVTTVVVTGQLDPATRAALVNQASVAAVEGDPRPNNNLSGATVPIAAQIDLSVTKTASPLTPTAGLPLTYTLVVVNAGPSQATDLVLTDTLPSGVTFITTAVDQGTAYMPLPMPDYLTYTFAALSPGEAVTVTVALLVNPDSRGTLLNTATITGREQDTQAANNTRDVALDIRVSAALAIEKRAWPVTARAGASLTYTLVLTNNGPSLATGVVLTDTLPMGTTVVTATSSQGMPHLPASSAALTYTLGTLDVGQSTTATLLVDVAPSVRETLVNTATVTAVGNLPHDNAYRVFQTPVYVEADLVLTAWAAPDPVMVTESLVYTATLRNAGPAMATSVRLTQTLPVAVTFSSASPPCAETSPGSVSCDINTLSLNATETFTVMVTVGVEASNRITNTLRVTAAEVDGFPGDNVRQVPVTVVGEAWHWLYLPLALR